jgi:hypothetical protein
MNRRILETSEEIDPLNTCALAFLRGLNPQSMVVALMAIHKAGKEFQYIGGPVLRSDNVK